MRTLLADIGNTAIKVGELQSTILDTACRAPEWNLPLHELPPVDFGSTPTRWICVSVNPKGLQKFVEMVSDRQEASQLRIASFADFGMPVDVTEPDRLGMDRVAAGSAAIRIKAQDAGAIVIDVGTATTVDTVTAEGQFLGGAILGSPDLLLRALNQNTQALPQIAFDPKAEPPAAIGRNTEQAMASGAYWGQVGALNELIRQYQTRLGSTPEVMLCGGGSEAIAPHLHLPPRVFPGLVLAGLATLAEAETGL